MRQTAGQGPHILRLQQQNMAATVVARTGEDGGGTRPQPRQVQTVPNGVAAGIGKDTHY
jgi:hypothetical protein